MKIEEMGDVFLNSANFAPHAFLTLAPPSGYALNLKGLIKVSKVSWTSHLSYKILRFSLERQFDKTNFICLKSTPPKSLGLLWLIETWDYTNLKDWLISFDYLQLIFSQICCTPLLKIHNRYCHINRKNEYDEPNNKQQAFYIKKSKWFKLAPERLSSCPTS